MASQRSARGVPSPLLTVEQVEGALIDELGNLGAMGGGIGGSFGGGRAGARGGASGGRGGARFGGRRLTRLHGAQSRLAVPRTEGSVHAVRAGFFHGAVQERYGRPPGASADALMLAGVVGAGLGNLSPCVVQIVWFDAQLFATAHAKEGLINQRTSVKALRSLADILGVDRPA